MFINGRYPGGRIRFDQDQMVCQASAPRGSLRIRIDDNANPDCWFEITIDPGELHELGFRSEVANG